MERSSLGEVRNDDVHILHNAIGLSLPFPLPPRVCQKPVAEQKAETRNTSGDDEPVVLVRVGSEDHEVASSSTRLASCNR